MRPAKPGSTPGSRYASVETGQHAGLAGSRPGTEQVTPAIKYMHNFCKIFH
jgi:hypothetical protein